MRAEAGGHVQWYRTRVFVGEGWPPVPPLISVGALFVRSTPPTTTTFRSCLTLLYVVSGPPSIVRRTQTAGVGPGSRTPTLSAMPL